jgi:hypothetical protein
MAELSGVAAVIEGALHASERAEREQLDMFAEADALIGPIPTGSGERGAGRGEAQGVAYWTLRPCRPAPAGGKLVNVFRPQTLMPSDRCSD